MPILHTGRKHLSELVKAHSTFSSDFGINFHVGSVDVEGSGDVDNIGTLLQWSQADGAFKPLVATSARANSTAYALGEIVRPAVSNGLEYVVTSAGTSQASEPTMGTHIGGNTTDGTVTWQAQLPYVEAGGSPLPNKASVCVAVGAKEGVGFNKLDTTLSATAVKMTVLFRGPAGIVQEGIEGFSALDPSDQADIKSALERAGVAVADSAEQITSSYVV